MRKRRQKPVEIAVNRPKVAGIEDDKKFVLM